MTTDDRILAALRAGLPAEVEEDDEEEAVAAPVVADTFAGRVHVEWDGEAAVTPLGQLPFFIEYLKQGGLFDSWVADCPLYFTSPNAPSKRNVLGTVLLSLLAGHRRYAHITSDNDSPCYRITARRLVARNRR